MKVLFVLRTAGYFPYHQTTIEHLLRRGHDVTLAFDHDSGPIDERGFHDWLASAPPVTVRRALRRRGFWRHVLFATREIRSYASYCRRGPQLTFYRNRWLQYLPSWAAWLAADHRPSHVLFRLPLLDRLLDVIERVAPPAAPIVAELRRNRPDCVVASPANLRFDEEIEYVKAAKSLNIPCVVPVLSWDNLTTKGLLHVHPDLVLAWHRGHEDEAHSIHGVPGDRIVVTGSPFFDKWFRADREVGPRAETCHRIGLEVEAPYLVYLGSSANIARDESWLVIKLAHALRESADPAVRALHIVFKPHPANLRAIPRLDAAGIPVWPRERGRPDTLEAVDAFRAVLHHAVAVVGINTTGMLDAILCNRPCLALEMEKYRFTQTYATHFRRMTESKALMIARSIRQAVRILERLMGGDDRATQARRTFASVYARPRGLGAQAGEGAAMAIELASQRLSAAAITAALDDALARETQLLPSSNRSNRDQAALLKR
jgi:hypothetical protein